MTVIDTHVHVWDLARNPSSWLGPGHGDLFRSHEFPEVRDEMIRAGVDRAILVQAGDTDAEKRYLVEVAATHREVAGVVAPLPLETPGLVARLLPTMVAEPLVVGIRVLAHTREDPDWLLRPEIRESLELVADAGLPFEVVAVEPRRLELVSRLARAHPSLTIVLDHLGRPPLGDLAGMAGWRDRLAAVARAPRVIAKLSGLAGPRGDLARWTSRQAGEAIGVALDLFGTDRVMFGSDWPMCRRAGGYRRVYDAVAEALSDLDARDARRVWAGNAMRVYGLRDAAVPREEEP